MHVTVAFLGRVADPAALVLALREAVREVVGDTPEGEPGIGRGPGPAARGPAPIRFRGLGAFPSARRAQVCWAGVDGGSCLPALHAAVAARVGSSWSTAPIARTTRTSPSRGSGARPTSVPSSRS